MKVTMSSKIASEVAKALNRQADSFTDTLSAFDDGEPVELEHEADELEYIVDELRRVAQTILDNYHIHRKCTICGASLTAEECFEMPAPRMCNEA